MTEQQQLHQQQHNGESQNEKKGLLNSRLVERALGYSWIKYGWDTASKTYETVKQSNSLAKVLLLLSPPLLPPPLLCPFFCAHATCCHMQYGCELAESNVSKVVHSPLVEGSIHFFAPLIVIADEFSVRQIDKVPPPHNVPRHSLLCFKANFVSTEIGCVDGSRVARVRLEPDWHTLRTGAHLCFFVCLFVCLLVLLVEQVEKGAELGQRLVQKVVVDPVSATYNAATSLPSRLLDRAEALLDYYLPEEKQKGDEGPTAGKSRRDSQDGRVRYAQT